MADFGNVQNFGFSFFLTIPINPQKKDQFHQYVLTNGRGKIKWLILVTCKISHLPFFPCRHILIVASWGDNMLIYRISE